MASSRPWSRRLLRWLVVTMLLLVVAFLAHHCAFRETLADWRQHPDPAGSVTAITEASLYAVQTGSGAPCIVLEAGLGSRADTWAPLRLPLAGCGTVLAYDRGDYGWSRTGNYPRTPETESHELGELLAHRELEGPIVLVGHSFGAQLVLHHALHLPQRDRIVGLVLIDPGPMGGDAAMRRLAATPGLGDQARALVHSLADQEQIFATEWFATTGLLYRLYQLTGGEAAHLGMVLNASCPEWYRALRSERDSARSTFTPEELERLAKLPMVLITANAAAMVQELGRTLPASDSATLVSAYRQGQLDHLRLCRQSRHVEARSGDHDLHRTAPELVVEAIRSLLH